LLSAPCPLKERIDMKEVAKNYTMGFIIIFAISAYVGSFLAVRVIYSFLPSEMPPESLYVSQKPLQPTAVMPSRVQLQPAGEVE
jgi:hypothetical protein